MSYCPGCGRTDMAGVTHVCPPLPSLAAATDRSIPEFRLNLTPKEATKGRRVLIRLNDWLATDGRYAVVPQDALDVLGGLLAECYRSEQADETESNG